MTRPAIIETYRQRIHQGQRQRLTQLELDQLITSFIETLVKAESEIEIKTLCQSEIELLEEGYPQTTLATKYLSRYRKAIQQAIDNQTLPLTPTTSHQHHHQQRITGIQQTRIEHWAITHLKYSPEIYQTLDKRQSQTNRTKQLSLKTVPLERYLQTLQSLLTDQNPQPIKTQTKTQTRNKAIAIAGLTGRRIGEVLARGTFQLTDHPHMLYFQGQQKKERPGYNIITLIPAAALRKQIEQFRQHPDIQPITQLKGEPLKSAINQFDVQINRQCNRILGQSGIIPPLENKTTVSVHNLRSLWGAIAAHLFCPDHYHEYAFLQHYLGHVLDSSATGNYFRYQLIDPQGNLLRQKGILLNQIGGLPLIEEIDQNPTPPTTPRMPQSPIPQPENPPTESPTESDLHQLRTEWQQTLTQKMIALRSELETQLETQLQQLRQPPTPDPQLLTRLQTLEQENLTLKQQLTQAQTKLDRFRQLLNSPDPLEPEPEPKPEPENQTEQPQTKNSAIAEPVSKLVEPVSKPRGPHPGKAFQRAETIVLAIKDWNRLHPSETFAINAGLLETVFRVHRQAVKTFLDAYQNELWEYHQDIGVESPRWHNRGKDTQKLKTYVTQSLEH